jgi:hypothetical protein
MHLLSATVGRGAALLKVVPDKGCIRLSTDMADSYWEIFLANPCNPYQFSLRTTEAEIQIVNKSVAECKAMPQFNSFTFCQNSDN